MTTLGKRQYQDDCKAAIWNRFTAGINRQLVQQATGTGKTIVFTGLRGTYEPVLKWLETYPEAQRRMLVIAHREELLDQAADKMRRVAPKLMIGIEQGERRASVHSDVVIASIQTLAAESGGIPFRRLQRFLRVGPFRVVVIDEAHHASAATYRNALVHLGFLPPADATDEKNIEAADWDDVVKMREALQGWDKIAPKDQLLLGVTATPNRSDAIGLDCVFQELVFAYPIKQAIADGWLVPITPWVAETDVDLDAVKITAGEFNQKQLAEAVNNELRNQCALALWNEKAAGRPTLGFTVDVAHAHAMADLFNAAGVPSVAISGKTPKEERRQILGADGNYTQGDFYRGRYKVVFNCMVLTEGTDLPFVSAILHLKPTKSATLYEQMTGRGLRLNEGKTDCVVLDVVDIARKHSLQTTPVLFGLPPGLMVNGQDPRDVEKELNTLKEDYPAFNAEEYLKGRRVTLADLKTKATTFNIWTIPSMGPLASAVTLNWIPGGTDVYRLSYPWMDGSELLIVQRNMLGKFEVSATLRPKNGGIVRQRTIVSGEASALEALMKAEQFVKIERGSAASMRDKNASWRKKAASPGQMGLLRKWRVPFNMADLMKPGGSGHASDLIDLAVQRRTGGMR